MTIRDTTRKITPWLTIAAVVSAAAIQLHRQGRIWWCACGSRAAWAGDIWSAHNSQHLFDPYAFTHVLHGVVFYGILAWLLPRIALPWRLAMAVSAESLWEVLENAPLIIDRYRSVTISLGYEGDSVLNSLADVACCSIGFLVAKRLGWRRSAILFVVTELALALWIRDNLTLNILMLIYPVDAVRTWQMVH